VEPGKAERAHPSTRVLSWGGAMPVGSLMPLPKGIDGPQLPFPASWRESTPASFDAAPLGTYPRGGGFSLVLFSALLLAPCAVEWLPVPSQQQIARTVANTVVFLPTVLHGGTRTRFSCSRYYLSLLFVQAKNGNRRAKAGMRLTPWVLHRGGLRRAKAPSCQNETSSLVLSPCHR